MADCPYAQMEWYCCLAEGHDGPHQSVTISGPDLAAEGQSDTSPTHDPEEASGDGITDDTDAIQRGGWWPKRGEPYTSPTHDPEDRKVKDGEDGS